MGPPILDRTVSVWRRVNNPTGQPRQIKAAVYSAIRASIVPISSFDADKDYARESTHVIWVPHWLVLRRDDEIRWGQRDADNFGDVAAEAFIVVGRRLFTHQGPRERSYYAKALS